MPLKDIQKPRRIIRLYHGSPVLDIDKFDLSYSRDSFLDFGRGMYFTTSEEQAMIWSIKKSNIGAVYMVEIDSLKLNLKQYLTYSNEFINTFCLCRAGFEEEVYDIKGYNSIYGYVIDNDKDGIVKSTNDYVLGIATAAQVRANIKVYEDKDQLCVKSQDILDNMIIKSVRYTTYVGGYPRNDRRSVRWKKWEVV